MRSRVNIANGEIVGESIVVVDLRAPVEAVERRNNVANKYVVDAQGLRSASQYFREQVDEAFALGIHWNAALSFAQLNKELFASKLGGRIHGKPAPKRKCRTGVGVVVFKWWIVFQRSLGQYAQGLQFDVRFVARVATNDANDVAE